MEIKEHLVDKTIIRTSVGEKWMTIFFTDGSRLELEASINSDDEWYPEEISGEMIVTFVESGNS